VLMECDFVFKTFNLIKSVIRHEEVLALRYLRDVHCLLSIGTEGRIFLSNLKETEYDTNDNYLDILNIEQQHKLIWNQISTIEFMTDNRILAGKYFLASIKSSFHC